MQISRNCHSCIQGWSFRHLLICCWLLGERQGDCTCELSKSHTNIRLDVSLPFIGCPIWKNDYCYGISKIFNLLIMVHYHCHCNSPSAGFLCPCSHNCLLWIGDVFLNCYWSDFHGYWHLRFNHWSSSCCCPGICYWGFDHCYHCCLWNILNACRCCC